MSNDKPNKPQNVIEHEHFWVHTFEEIHADERLDELRFDACRLADGSCWVWDVQRDIWTSHPTYEAARQAAALWARIGRYRLCVRPFVNLRLDGPNIDVSWLGGSERPLMLDVPSEECHPIRSLTADEARTLRDWLTERLGDR